MKKFNQMTEFQMSKTNGGLILGVIVGLFSSLAAAISIGTTAEAIKRK